MVNVTPAGAGVTGPAVYIGGTTVANGTNGYLLYNNNGVLGNIAISAISPPITIGTTTISNGTNGRILYDNNGVVGELAVTGTAGSAVLSVAPTLTSAVQINGSLNFNQGNVNAGVTVASATDGFLTLVKDSNPAQGFGFLVAADSVTLRNRLNGADATFAAGVATFSGAVTVPGGGTAALTSTATFTSGAGAQAGTLTNAPAAGNPTSWIKIIDQGTTRYIPAW